MSRHNLKFLDFEVYPEWWCLVVSDEEDNYPGGLHNNQFTREDETKIKSKMRVYRSDMNSDQDAIRTLVKKELIKGILCGHNIKRYDMIIANCVILGFSPKNLYIVSEMLIDESKKEQDALHIRLSGYTRRGFLEAEGWQDLLDDSEKSLKDKECSLGMDIRETDVPFGKVDLTEQEKEEIISYCKHDVFALHVHYWVISRGYIDTKIDLCNAFGLSHKTGYINTNANLCGKVLEAKRIHGTTITDPTIIIRDQALKEYFEKWIPADILNKLLTETSSKTFYLYENEVTIGDGGLHSVYRLPKLTNKDNPGLYIEADDEWTMYNVDASSCYASVMMYCDAMSRAIKNPQRLKEIYLRRIKLKLTPKSQWALDDFAFVAAAKLVLNTTYGAMGNKWLDLYDDYMRSKVCRVGQMILIAIANNLFSSIKDLKVIQNNTDGILVYARRSSLDEIKSIVDEFSKISNFIFEVEEDIKLWQLNVNNYVAVHPDGEVKNKGSAFVTSVYCSGYNKIRPLSNFCIQKAQIEFYVNKKNPIKELLENTNVSDFCLTATKGPTYKSLIQYINGTPIDLGRVSRVIAVQNKEFGDIKKRKIYTKATKNNALGSIKEDTIPLCPPHPLAIKDALYNYYIKDRKLYHKETGESWDIDYVYYARELEDALDVIWYKLSDGTLKRINIFNL